MSAPDNKAGGIPIRVAGSKELGADKMSRNTASFDPDAPRLRKPDWIRVKLPAGSAVQNLKSRLRERSLVTVCEEAT
ncbi:MAG: lipoyl synthase, partial [Xanthomonadales bacterium]|nr:lipoyl synthase [Xanthomonadales bacterium]